jgi:hypothetical protein
MTVGVEAQSYKKRFAGLGHLKPGWISKVLNYFEIDKIQNLHQRDRRDGEWEQFLKAGPLLFLAIPFVYSSFYHLFRFLKFEKEKSRSLLLLISVSILTWLLTWQGMGRHFRKNSSLPKIATLARNPDNFLTDSLFLLLRPIARKIYNLPRCTPPRYRHQRLRLGLHAVSSSRFTKTLELLSRFRHFNSDFPTCFALSFHREPRK